MYCINKLKSFIPPLWIYKKNYLLAKKEEVNIPLGKKVFVFLAANYGNLGDIAITYAQHKCIEKKFTEYAIVEVSANCTLSYLKGIVSKVEKHDIVTFVGGGNMGDMYPLYENIRQLLISILSENRIIQFPLTADFSSTRESRLMKNSARRIYGNHKRLTIFSREKKSEEFLSGLLKKSIIVVPDIVMTLDYFDYSAPNRSGVSLCLRHDKEKVLSDETALSIEKIINRYFSDIEYADTLVDDKLVTIDNKERLLDSYLRNLATRRLLVTDRLHGMIFAYITGTPAIVFSNSNQKVKFCYEWIKDCSYIYFMEKYNETVFSSYIKKALTCRIDREKFLNRNAMFNEMILNAI